MEARTARALLLLSTILGATAAWGQGASATIRVTPPVRNSDGQNLLCVAQNLGGSSVSVTAELVDSTGMVAESGTQSLDPGEPQTLVSNNDAIFGGYCRFSSTAPGVVRGAISLQDSGGSNTRLLAVAARLDEVGAFTSPLVTPALRNSDGQNLLCVAQNLGASPAEVTAELVDSTGMVAESGTQTLDPDEPQTLVSNNDAIFGGYCRFSFGASDVVWGSISLQDSGGSNTRLLAPAIALDEVGAFTSPLVTPALRNSDGQNLLCVAQNLGASPAEVTAELVDSTGMVAESGTQTLDPDEPQTLVSNNDAIFGGYCRFSFGASDVVWGSISLQDSGGSNTRLLAPAIALDEGSRAFGSPLATPPVRNSDGQNLLCVAQNLGASSAEVTAELVDSTGMVAESGTQTLDPDEPQTLVSNNEAIFGGYCRFTFGGPDVVWGAISLQDSGGSNTRLLVPAPEPGGRALQALALLALGGLAALRGRRGARSR